MPPDSAARMSAGRGTHACSPNSHTWCKWPEHRAVSVLMVTCGVEAGGALVDAVGDVHWMLVLGVG